MTSQSAQISRRGSLPLYEQHRDSIVQFERCFGRCLHDADEGATPLQRNVFAALTVISNANDDLRGQVAASSVVVSRPLRNLVQIHTHGQSVPSPVHQGPAVPHRSDTYNSGATFSSIRRVSAHSSHRPLSDGICFMPRVPQRPLTSLLVIASQVPACLDALSDPVLGVGAANLLGALAQQ